MNVIISNKKEAQLAELKIDVIKSINGTFTVDELTNIFRNFYFNKMIIDITAIKDYENINSIQSLSLSFDTSKIILFLDDSPKVNSQMYLSQLVSVGIYNFANSIENVEYLVDNPNIYKDVAHYQKLSATADDFIQNDKELKEAESMIRQRVIGIVNLTPHAGSTTFSYILEKHIERLYDSSIVEVGGNDFSYLNDKSLDSISSFDLKNYIESHADKEVIVVDLRDSKDVSYCTDILYLIEPGLIQLNRLIKEDPLVFKNFEDKKLVLNKSVLDAKDVEDFEREARVKVFYNVPLIDDKDDSIGIINKLLYDLGFTRFQDESEKAAFKIFK